MLLTFKSVLGIELLIYTTFQHVHKHGSSECFARLYNVDHGDTDILHERHWTLPVGLLTGNLSIAVQAAKQTGRISYT